MYKVFVDNISIYFQKDGIFKSNISSQYFPAISVADYKLFIEEVNKINLKEKVVVFSPDPKAQLLEFFSNFKWIEAAGGIVLNTTTNQALFIHRNGFWDIPKGKLEKNENPEQGAIREIEEECGLGNLKILGELSPTYHTYFAYGKHVIKKTHWFSLVTDELNVTPQIDEGITEVKWFETDNLNLIKNNTFTSILDVMEEYFGK
ncbi:NUDIX hydrolase [Brumimicrobium mesophilum]|uniref:NUDIX hydrolase n=1 Tax=Brumimicrobium mesophilum TaxID=392717 RepID=UPI000D144E5E|nr:NUDIX domain-containing protein [Brumimicrobium mesophilum]